MADVRPPDAYLDLFERPLFAALATVTPDGAPLVNPMWFEWDNAAVIPITTYSEWLEKRIESSVRRAVKKAVKSGVTVRIAEFNDDLVRGIVNINNETPIRQGNLSGISRRGLTQSSLKMPPTPNEMCFWALIFRTN